MKNFFMHMKTAVRTKTYFQGQIHTCMESNKKIRVRQKFTSFCEHGKLDVSAGKPVPVILLEDFASFLCDGGAVIAGQ